MRLPICLALSAAMLLSASCFLGSQPDEPEPVQPHPLNAEDETAIPEEEIVAGQTIYVPVYSHIYHLNETRAFNLTATLSIRNTDLERPIVVTSMRYYDSDGRMLREYLERPAHLDPLATADQVVPQADETGGAGANFIVEWVATEEVSSPIVEAVMIRTSNQQGISFVSRGVVIAERTPQGAADE